MTAGGIDQEIHIIFNAYNESDHDDKDKDKLDNDQHLSRRDDDDDNIKFIEDHIQRAYVSYTVTDEIKVRHQLEFLTPVAIDLYCNIPLMSPDPPFCGPAPTVGNLQWDPGSAKEDKKQRANAEGPFKDDDKKAGSGIGVSFDIHSYIECLITWCRPMATPSGLWTSAYFFGWILAFRPKSTCKYDLPHEHSNDIELTLSCRTFPGYEATIPVGSVLEVDLGKGDEGPVNSTNFDPIMKMLPVNVSVSSSEIHLNVAIGPKAGLNIGLPTIQLGMGIGVRLDLIRFDGKFSEYKSKRSSRLVWKTLKLNEATRHLI